MSQIWLMVGSSPSVIDVLPKVRESLTNPTIITCNSGIKIVHPRHYVCVEQTAVNHYANAAQVAKSCGVNLITLNRSHLRSRNVHWYTEFIENQPGPPTREKYGEFRRSGGLTLEYACRNGAKEIHLVGVDGHRNENDYFDGEILRRITKDSENDVLTELYTQIATVFDDIQFFHHGDPVLDIQANNWEVVRYG